MEMARGSNEKDERMKRRHCKWAGVARSKKRGDE